MDIHCHILYGLDDGAKSRKMMYAMLRRAATEGITRIVATPHVTPGVHRFDREQYATAIQEAAEYCMAEGLGISLYEGCEILYTSHTSRFLNEGKIPTLAGTERVLVEFSPDIRYEELCDALDDLQHNGFLPVVAHVERYRCLAVWPSRAEKIKQNMEVYFQMNCSSVYKEKSWFTRRFVHWALENRQIDALGTDSHNTSSRPANMKKAYKAVKQKYSAGYAKHLTGAAFMFENKE